MSAIVRRVLDSNAHDRLAAYTSMHDLIVVPVSAAEPPYGVAAVRAPGSLRDPRDGQMFIEHLFVTAHDDQIERPVAEAVSPVLAVHDREVRRGSRVSTITPTKCD